MFVLNWIDFKCGVKVYILNSLFQITTDYNLTTYSQNHLKDIWLSVSVLDSHCRFDLTSLTKLGLSKRFLRPSLNLWKVGGMFWLKWTKILIPYSHPADILPGVKLDTRSLICSADLFLFMLYDRQLDSHFIRIGFLWSTFVSTDAYVLHSENSDSIFETNPRQWPGP